MEMVRQIWLLVILDGDVEKIISRHFEELGLGEFINPIKADYSAAMADIISRYKMVNLFYFILGLLIGLWEL